MVQTNPTMDHLVEAVRIAAKEKPRMAPFRIYKRKGNAKDKKRLTRLAMDSGAMTSLQRFRRHVGSQEDPDLVERVYESLRGAEETRICTAREQERINERALQQAQTRKAEIEAARQRHATWLQYVSYLSEQQQEREEQKQKFKWQEETRWQKAAQAQVEKEVAMAIEAKQGGNGKAVYGRCNHCFAWIRLTSDGMLRRHGGCAGSNSLDYARAK